MNNHQSENQCTCGGSHVWPEQFDPNCPKHRHLSSNQRATPLPCPSCDNDVGRHSDEAYWFNGEGPPPCYAVECGNCGMRGPYGYGRERGDHWGAKDEAAKRWNDLPRSAVETSGDPRSKLQDIITAYDHYRGKGVSPAPREYQAVVDAINAARSCAGFPVETTAPPRHDITCNYPRGPIYGPGCICMVVNKHVFERLEAAALKNSIEATSEPSASPRRNANSPCAFEFSISPPENYCLNCGWLVSAHRRAEKASGEENQS